MTYIILKQVSLAQIETFIDAFSIAHLSSRDLFELPICRPLYSPAPYVTATALDVDYVQAHCAFTRTLKKCSVVGYARSLPSDSWIISNMGASYAGYIDDASIPALKAQVDVQIRIGQLQAAKKALGKQFGAWDGRQYVRYGLAQEIDAIEQDIDARLKHLNNQTAGFSTFIQR
jgi:hypothetical protein